MALEYRTNYKITVDEFIDILVRSRLATRRPIADRARLSNMLANATLTCTTWHDDLLVGIARSLTDFSYCCYLSDLAVDAAYQKKGVGKALMQLTRSKLHPMCKIILLAAPDAESYYPKIGFTPHHSAWVDVAGTSPTREGGSS